MNKALFAGLLVCAGLPATLVGQTPNPIFAGGHILFDFTMTDTRFMVRQQTLFMAPDTAVWEALEWPRFPFNIESNMVPKSPIMMGVKLSPNFSDPYQVAVKSVSKDFSSYRITDSSDATVIALGITKENVADYNYHIVENDSTELLPWSPVRQLQQQFGARRPYAFLGKFNAPGKRIMIEVVNRKNYSIRDGVILDWRKDFRPVITEMDVDTKSNRYWNLHSSRGSTYATRFDPQTNMPLDLKFPVDTVDELQLTFAHHETLPYTLYLLQYKGAKTDTTALSWWFLEDIYHFDGKNFDKPGRYEFVVQARGEWKTWDSSQTVRIPFEVSAPVLQRKISLRQLAWYVLFALTGIGVLFGLYYARNRRMMKRSALDRQMAALQLRAIRSQLNPHFMFNALSSIQNLMNRNDLAGANRYLSTFAGLTRKVLLAGDQELISLEEEMEILEGYLKMEQLRFGFCYVVRVDPAIDRSNVEIPSMLLQPFVENAVKHGVNALQDAGRIEVSIGRTGNDLLLTVTDNGKGFDPTAPSGEDTGFGLKLGEERISLLNQLNKDAEAVLKIQTGAGGTTVAITLPLWL